MNYWEMNQTQEDISESGYPKMYCKEAVVNVVTTYSSLFFAVACGLATSTLLILGIKDLALAIQCGYFNIEAIRTGRIGEDTLCCLILGIMFLIATVVMAYTTMKYVLRYIKVKTRGERILAKVYGYENDPHYYINHRPSQIVELIASTHSGMKSISYRLHSRDRPYAVDTTIEILMYEDLVLIPKQRRKY